MDVKLLPVCASAVKVGRNCGVASLTITGRIICGTIMSFVHWNRRQMRPP